MPTPLTGWSAIMPAAACQMLKRPDKASFKPARSPLRAAMLRSTRLPNCAEKLKASAAAMLTPTSMVTSRRLRPNPLPAAEQQHQPINKPGRARAGQQDHDAEHQGDEIQPLTWNLPKAASSANGESVASTSPSF